MLAGAGRRRNARQKRDTRFPVPRAGHAGGVADDDPREPASEGDRAWRERMQETGDAAERLQPPVPDHPESAPSPNPADPAREHHSRE